MSTNPIPKSWARIRLCDLWRESRERVNPKEIEPTTYVGLEHIEPGSSCLAGTGVSTDVKSTVAVFAAGDVLYGRLRPYLNKVVQPSFGGVASTEFLVFKESPLISNSLLQLFLSSSEVVSYAHANSSGVSLPRVSGQKLGELEVGLPPRAEQRRIIAKIEELFSELDAGTQALESVQAKLERYRASVLKAAVEGKLTEQWRKENPAEETGQELLNGILVERRARWEEEQLAKYEAKGKKPPKNWQAKYKEPVGPDTSQLVDLPEGWCWGTLDQLTSLITSGSRGWSKYYSSDGPLFIRAQDIKTDSLRAEGVAHVSLPGAIEGSRTQVQLNDMLVTITGANVTKTALVTIEPGEAYVSQHVGLVRPVEPRLAPYLHNWVITPAGGRRRLEEAAYGAGKPGLNLGHLRELPVAVPPLAEHEEIVLMLGHLETQTDPASSLLNVSRARSATLRQSILKRAFEGSLVPQDPGDEPASELLERIRAQRAADTPKKKRRTKKTPQPELDL